MFLKINLDFTADKHWLSIIILGNSEKSLEIKVQISERIWRNEHEYHTKRILRHSF